MIGPTYFQQGSAWGLNFNVGAGFRPIQMCEIRLGFNLENYGLSFKTLPTDTYLANGASDLIVGLTVGVAFVY